MTEKIPLEIGQPLVMKSNTSKVYGRIVGLESMSIIIFSSPHGTEVRTSVIGLQIWTGSQFGIPDDEDMKALADLERDALSKGRWYNGKLPAPDFQI